MKFDPSERIVFLSARAAFLLDLAKQKGAQEVKVRLGWGGHQKLGCEKNDYSLISGSEGGSVTITVHYNQRRGTAGVNRLDDESLTDAVERAIAMAKFAVPDEFLCLAKPGKIVDLPSRFDPMVQNLSAAWLMEQAESIFSASSETGTFTLDGAQVECSAGVFVIANSEGVHLSDANTSVSWQIMGMAKREQDVTSFDYTGDGFHLLSDVQDGPAQSGRKLAQKLHACLNAKKGESYKGVVLFPPSMVEEFLVDPVVFHLLGSNLMDDRSRWQDSIGKKVADSSFSFYDKVHDISLNGASAFNGDGIPTREMTILEDGRLASEMDSLYTANRRGTHPTGNGSGPAVLEVREGEHELEQLRACSKIILEPSRFSGNVDPVTGDFSGVAKGSRLWKNGQDAGPVVETMISGNVFEILERPLLFSREREEEFHSSRVPWCAVDGVSVTGT